MCDQNFKKEWIYIELDTSELLQFAVQQGIINNQIAVKEDELKSLKLQKKELEKEIEEQEKDRLYKSLKDVGITVGEFQNILEMHANAEVKK